MARSQRDFQREVEERRRREREIRERTTQARKERALLTRAYRQARRNRDYEKAYDLQQKGKAAGIQVGGIKRYDDQQAGIQRDISVEEGAAEAARRIAGGTPAEGEDPGIDVQDRSGEESTSSGTVPDGSSDATAGQSPDPADGVATGESTEEPDLGGAPDGDLDNGDRPGGGLTTAKGKTEGGDGRGLRTGSLRDRPRRLRPPVPATTEENLPETEPKRYEDATPPSRAGRPAAQQPSPTAVEENLPEAATEAKGDVPSAVDTASTNVRRSMSNRLRAAAASRNTSPVPTRNLSTRDRNQAAVNEIPIRSGFELAEEIRRRNEIRKRLRTA